MKLLHASVHKFLGKTEVNDLGNEFLLLAGCIAQS